jgi:uncharacterized membrane protein
MLVLRFIHIIASVCWAGGGFIFFLFIEPTAKALAPTGIQFIQFMVTKRRFNIFMVVSSALTVLSGALLIWLVTNGQLLNYMNTGPGLGFTLGSIAGIAVYFVGLLGVNPRAVRMSKLGAEIQAVGGPPTPAQGAELHKRLRLPELWSVSGSAGFRTSPGRQPVRLSQAFAPLSWMGEGNSIDQPGSKRRSFRTVCFL